MDAEPNQTSADAAPADGVEQPDAERVSADQLSDYLVRAHFATTLGRRGYRQAEVEAFLVQLAEAVRAGEPVADLVRRHRFSQVRLEDGYDESQVDEFLAAVADLDPLSEAPAAPEVRRGGLLTRLFG